MTGDNALRDHLRKLIDAQGPNGYVMSYALEAALKAHPETDDGAGTPPAAVAAAGETATPAPSSPTLNRDAVAQVLYDYSDSDGAADAIVALARPESEVREHIAREIEAGRHANCADGQHQPCSVCWALGEVARNARSGAAS